MSYSRKSAYLHKQEEWKALYESGESFRSIARSEGVYYRTVQGVLRGIVEPRPKQTYVHLTDEWIEAHLVKEMNITEIAEAYKVDSATVTKYLKNAGVQIRNSRNKKSPFEAVIPAWVERYKQGETLKQIATAYDTYPQTVHKHIHQKVKMRHYAETSQVHEIESPDYFETIDSHEKAYWLGIWYGTGFVAKTPLSRECTLLIRVEERLTIDRFKEVVGYGKEVVTIKRRRSEVARLRIHNKEFAKSLEANGLISDKSEDLRFPEHIPSAFIPSFVLGYYEGKGSCYVQSHMIKGVEYKQIALDIYGTPLFLEELKKRIKQATNMDVSVKKEKKRNGTEGFRYEIRTSRLPVIEAISDWLYKDAPVYSSIRDIREKLIIRKQPRTDSTVDEKA